MFEKPTICGIGTCVEVDGAERKWKKADMCGAGACVEVSHEHDHVWVRSSQAPQVAIGYTHEEWAAFIAGVKKGEFDLP